MAFFYIVGVAGSGKSTVQADLKLLGYQVFDEDQPEIGSARNKVTKELVSVPPASERDAGWFDRHEWNVPDSILDDLRILSGSEAVVLCGNSLTDDEIEKFIDAVIYLRIDEQTMATRLASRTDNDYGSTPSEVEQINERRIVIDQRFGDSALVIDANRSREAVVAEIVDVLQGTPRPQIRA